MSNTRKGHRGFVSRPLEERFWEKVDKKDGDGCWEWTGSTRRRGYGEIYVDGRIRRASQVAYELATGKPFPPDLVACHHCDNPGCVRPDHIFAGTMKDNILDAAKKGRLQAILDEDAVLEIRNRHASGETQTSLAEEFGVNLSTVNDVVNGRWWEHVGGPIRTEPVDMRGEGSPRSKLTRREVEEILTVVGRRTDQEIADAYGVSRTAIWDIRSGRKWKHVPRPARLLNEKDEEPEDE